MSHPLAWQVEDIVVNVLDQIIHHGVLHSQISSYHIVNNLSESFNCHHKTYLVMQRDANQYKKKPRIYPLYMEMLKKKTVEASGPVISELNIFLS